MRILHILNHTNRSNGHVHAAVDLACAQAKLGHNVCLASGGGDFDELLSQNSVSQTTLSHQRSPLSALRSIAALRAFVRNWQPDIVHAHMMTSAVLAWPVCKIAGVPLITTVHNEFEKSAILMGLGSRVIAVSDAVGASMIKRGISARRLRVVLNGTIGCARSGNRTHVELALQSPSVLFVGGLHPRKGLPDLLEAFQIAHRDVPNSRLYVIGGGPFEQEYRDMASRMECASAILFMGPQDDPFSWMASADIFALPSHADPAPLVLSEAREAGCAIIGANVDGIPQLIEFGAAGLLVEPRDIVGWARVLRCLFESPSLVEEWQRKSQFNIERMTIKRVAAETLDVYKSALRDKSPIVSGSTYPATK
ncbi:glycosyltransferase family 4 protein [Rhizobium sp. VS19-DR104.2]|uniref:glycosyltransferase family 4 protein n=1 Tax=unclassified Rhizobium TaxID=2613769 RepID=UPI001CC7B2CF|nr:MULTISPECIES: glycosyltransferase family 4 protein [unclassified Rhizobium]MBZ5762957.1 glycosyltransferase family 4 protein [Rhizobium sp. VS19-DR96]MBZ5768790.1 glycosyltransferase family 4 protein [Rhizobium sp. VS19-DR129.2]MBZ5776406.1 glycosyltransferase family 4 protein [Rhizobium sp. VS19-DRK62.2]MBZ5787613.1 glycosyltransferase family 4 protein [Rhizobium sp. VS19-DR121]MBZ5804968.1 glycosyltransferase family 4 protein [Rhizobium sp. VS19-DR181]